MIDKYAFYVLSIFIVFSAAGVVTMRNLFHCGLLLGLTLLSVACFYALVGAEFIAAVQVLLYVGGVLTLILFAVMFTKGIADRGVKQSSGNKGISVVLCALLFAVLACSIIKTPALDKALAPLNVTTAGIGRVMLADYLLPFEIISVLLLSAIIGAVLISRRDARK